MTRAPRIFLALLAFASALGAQRPAPMTLPSDLRFWKGDWSAEFLVTVDSNGAVVRSIARPLADTLTGWGEGGIVAMSLAENAIAHWRFEPGVVGARPVRAERPVVVVVHSSPDTLPATAIWRYTASAVRDTLHLDWVVGLQLTLGDADDAGDAIALARGALRSRRLSGNLRDYPNGADVADAWLTAILARVDRMRDDQYVVQFRYPGRYLGKAPYAIVTCLVMRRGEWAVRCGV